MTTTIVPLGEAHALVAGALERSRTSPANAASVASALVAAELAGQPGHGLRRVAAYAAQAASGKVAGFAQPQVSQPRPGALLVDAGHGFAFPALDMALEPLAALARTQGLAAAGIRRSHHCGVAGLIAEAYADRGLAALVFANTPAAMAPWGSSRPLLGTNPVAFAAPVAGDDPVVVDVSLSKVARGKVMAAAQRGEPIPEGWAFDTDGHPTTDPQAALAGTMAPVGDAKGTALALMVELLAAGLVGANFAYEATSFFDDAGQPPGVGQLIIAIDPSTFGTTALARFTAMASAYSEAEGARLPGRRRQALRRQLEASPGLKVETALLRDLDLIGRGA